MTREAIIAAIERLEENAPLDGPEGEFWMGYRRALADVQDAVEARPDPDDFNYSAIEARIARSGRDLAHPEFVVRGSMTGRLTVTKPTPQGKGPGE